MKKTLSRVLLPILFLSLSAPLSGVSARTVAIMVNSNEQIDLGKNRPAAATGAAPALGTKVATKVAARTNLEHANADKEIDRRITALNALITRINGLKRVTDDQKTALLVQVQAAITDLTNLKAKVDADTDPATLKADKQSIVTSYRVFLLLIPKVEIMAHADLVLQLASQMTINDTTVQTKIQAAQDAKKDVTSITALLTDRQAQIADAQTKAQGAITSVSPLKPEDYPGNKSTLTSSRDQLKVARQDLTNAYQDLVKINTALAALK